MYNKSKHKPETGNNNKKADVFASKSKRKEGEEENVFKFSTCFCFARID